MNGVRFAEGLKVLPILKPQDIAANATASSYVDLDHINWATFLVSFGNLTSDSTDVITITVEASTAGTSNATEGNVAYSYRLTSAVDTDSHGAITAASATGIEVTATDDNKMVIIDVDPAVVAATADRQFVRIVLTPSAGIAVCLTQITALMETRYPQNLIPSST